MTVIQVYVLFSGINSGRVTPVGEFLFDQLSAWILYCEAFGEERWNGRG